MIFHDTAHNVQARVGYRFDDKSIAMYISETGDDDHVDNVNFIANINRYIDNDLSITEQVEFIYSVIENWKDDIDSFAQLAFQFYCNYSN